MHLWAWDERIEDLARAAAHYHVLDIPKIPARMALFSGSGVSERLLGQ
jgi:hypothetical protein